jgi:4-hydroxybenzoate polyprenyltransferase
MADSSPVSADVPSPAVLAGTETGGSARGSVRDWVRVLRPRQWIKNAFVVAPILFSGRALDPAAQRASLLAFLCFCLVASGVYALNDVADRKADRAHPVKRHRPVASGRVGLGAAVAAGALLLAAGLAGAWLMEPDVGLAISAYVLINVLYTLWLKHVVIVDVFCIASFFVIRLLTGAAAIDVGPSVWLLLCGGLLSLFLGFAKRRHEITLLGEGSREHRAVLSEYSVALLDQISVVLLAVTIVSYVMYTLTSRTAELVGSEALAYSTVFVLYGVLRYLYLAHRGDGGDPSDTLLRDGPLLAAVALWCAYCAYVVYR